MDLERWGRVRDPKPCTRVVSPEIVVRRDFQHCAPSFQLHPAEIAVSSVTVAGRRFSSIRRSVIKRGPNYTVDVIPSFAGRGPDQTLIDQVFNSDRYGPF